MRAGVGAIVVGTLVAGLVVHPAAVQAQERLVEPATARDVVRAAGFGPDIASGVGLGLIGTGIITGAAALGNPRPRETPADVDASCYRDGYSGRARGKNITSGLLGGLVGTAVWVAIVTSGS